MSSDYFSYLLLSMAFTSNTPIASACPRTSFDAVTVASLNAKNLDIWPALVGGTSVAGSILEAGVPELLLACPTPASSSDSHHAGSHISSSGSSKSPSSDSRSAPDTCSLWTCPRGASV